MNKKTFPLCGGCMIFGYCSVACQRAAWTFAACPHKEVCKPLGVLARIWGTDPSMTAMMLKPMLERTGCAADQHSQLLPLVALEHGVELQQVEKFGYCA